MKKETYQKLDKVYGDLDDLAAAVAERVEKILDELAEVKKEMDDDRVSTLLQTIGRMPERFGWTIDNFQDELSVIMEEPHG